MRFKKRRGLEWTFSFGILIKQKILSFDDEKSDLQNFRKFSSAVGKQSISARDQKREVPRFIVASLLEVSNRDKKYAGQDLRNILGIKEISLRPHHWI
jgi:hypothetical protein